MTRNNHVVRAYIACVALLLYVVLLPRTGNNYYPWDMGFEADTSFKTRVISGVRPDSNAYRAGLRDGQKWVSGGLVHGDPNRLTKLTVIDGGTQKVVQFYPAATEAIRLPQYKLKPDISAEEGARCLSPIGVASAAQRTSQSVKK